MLAMYCITSWHPSPLEFVELGQDFSGSYLVYCFLLPLPYFFVVVAFIVLGLFFFKQKITCMGVLPEYVWVYHVPDAHRAQKGHWIPWNWSYRLLWATTWVLVLEPGSSVKIVNVFNSWAVVSSSVVLFFETGFACVSVVSLKLKIILSQPSKWWDYRHASPCLAWSAFPHDISEYGVSFSSYGDATSSIDWRGRDRRVMSFRPAYTVPFQNFLFCDWRDGPVVGIVCCFCRGPRFHSQHPCGGSQPSMTNSRGSNASSDLCGYQTQTQ